MISLCNRATCDVRAVYAGAVARQLWRATVLLNPSLMDPVNSEEFRCTRRLRRCSSPTVMEGYGDTQPEPYTRDPRELRSA
jgi:hypothetical protein